MDKWNDGTDNFFAPKWMSLTMTICKWIIGVMPFILCSLGIFLVNSDMEIGGDVIGNYFITGLYLLSLANIINMVD